jgi:phosphatidylglycerol:prolipoprotein diacylglycerol transferase
MLNYIIWDINPEIFSVGSFSIRWYGLLFATGFLIGQRIMAHIFKTEGLKETLLDSLLLTMVVSTVLGARLGHFAFYEPQVFFTNPLQIITPPFAGLASHGATIGILLALFFYARIKKMSFLWIVDRIVITVAFAGFCIRFGNLMNSEIVGKVTKMPWGFVFKSLTEYGAESQWPRHPAQLYEAIACLVLCVILYKIWDKYKTATPHGLLLGLFLLWVFGLRFVWEFFKEPQVSFEKDMMFNMGQLLSIPAILLGFYYLWYARNNKDLRIFTDESSEKVEKL